MARRMISSNSEKWIDDVKEGLYFDSRDNSITIAGKAESFYCDKDATFTGETSINNLTVDGTTNLVDPVLNGEVFFEEGAYIVSDQGILWNHVLCIRSDDYKVFGTVNVINNNEDDVSVLDLIDMGGPFMVSGFMHDDQGNHIGPVFRLWPNSENQIFVEYYDSDPALSDHNVLVDVHDDFYIDEQYIMKVV